ncbi:MAG TPA: DUF2752 domain-containing protein [Marmoricola sp.]|jgi:hypothetical protein|nr:DUF2752 domain-containing protein [Marmoricola sp.]
MTALALPGLSSESRLRRLGSPLGTVAGIGIASLALHLRDPHQHGAWGLCPFKAMTGLDCPGCGGLRAVNDLTHGQIGAAFHSNALFVGSIPLLAVLWLVWAARSWNGSGALVSERAAQRLLYAVVVLAVVFAVWRNTPWGSAYRVS